MHVQLERRAERSLDVGVESVRHPALTVGIDIGPVDSTRHTDSRPILATVVSNAAGPPTAAGNDAETWSRSSVLETGACAEARTTQSSCAEAVAGTGLPSPRVRILCSCRRCIGAQPFRAEWASTASSRDSPAFMRLAMTCSVCRVPGRAASGLSVEVNRIGSQKLG